MEMSETNRRTKDIELLLRQIVTGKVSCENLTGTKQSVRDTEDATPAVMGDKVCIDHLAYSETM